MAKSGIEPNLIDHESIVLSITLSRLSLTLSLKPNYTNKETRTLKELLPLLLKRRLFTNFNMFVNNKYALFYLKKEK